MKGVLTAFAKNTVFANILLILIFLSGALAVTSMIREFFPEFSLDMINVTVPFPGADPEEVEEGISRKIEESLEGVEGIKQYTTYSAENAGSALIEVQEDYDVDEVLDTVRTNINAISTFPENAEKPVISEMALKDSVMVLSLSGDMSEKRLKEWAYRIEDEIQQLPEISQVTIFGVRDYEIGIEVSEASLREHDLSFSQVVDAIRRSSLNLAGGAIRTRGEEIRVRTVGRKYTGRELSGIIVIAKPTGEILTLDKIAVINDGFTEDPILAAINGKPAALLNIFKTREQDALTIASAIHRFISQKQTKLPPGAKINIIYETTGMLRARIDLLVKNGIIGLCLVFLVLWMFLNMRLSFWAGMGIPVSLSGGLVILWAIGGTINMISLFGLIMVLGIVVDDAIVVGEAIYVHRKNGDPPLKAAVSGVMEVASPVIAAVTTTIVAFLPLAFISGIMGKFIAILPLVVIACLAVSLIECLILLPAHLSHLPDPNIKTGGDTLFRRLFTINRITAGGLEWFVDRIYAPFLKIAIRWRYISFCTTVAILLITIGVMKGGLIKFHVFSEVDGFILNANVKFPNGTPMETTRKAVRKLDEAIVRLGKTITTRSGDPLIVDRLTIVGQSTSQIPENGPHYGGMIVTLLESEKRGVHSKDIQSAWEKEVGLIPGVESLTFEGMAHGPPGAPIEIWIQGRNMESILGAADEIMEKLRKFEGVYQIRSDFSPGKNELQLELKPEARALGLTVHDLAHQVYSGYYGEEAVRFQRGRDDIKVKVRYTADERSRIADLKQMRIRTPTGNEIPLFSVASVRYTPGYATITRTNGLRRVAVSAEVDTKTANADEIAGEFSQTYLREIKDNHPDLYFTFQGEKKKMRESIGSLKIGFPIAVIGIFIIIATIFRSYIQPCIILFTAPFGIIGAVSGHLVMGYDLSMMSLFGMVALTGVVVNDAIVMIERINENIAEGMGFFEAIENGGARRFRAVFLTTVSTVGGLTPLILETDFQAKFLIPMALSVAAGVIFATALTLLVIPSLFVIVNDLRRMTFWIQNGKLPAPEEVEPARYRKIHDSMDDVPAGADRIRLHPQPENSEDSRMDNGRTGYVSRKSGKA